MEKDVKKIQFCGFKDKTTPTFIEKDMKGKTLYYGVDNKFPDYLFDLYLKSALLQSICNGTSDMVMGDKIIIENSNYWKDYINDDGDSIIDIMKKCIIDYMIFGGYALKINKNGLDEVVDIQWIDFKKLRTDKNGDIIFYYKNGYGTNSDVMTYPRFHSDKKYPTSIFYYNGHISRGVYPVPIYNGALSAIETSIEISKFHLSTIRKNFSGNFIINYNDSNYTEEQKHQIKDAIKKQYTGTDNAGSVMLAFNNGKENAVTITRIPEDNFDKKYDALKESTFKEIFIGFRATPQLFGFTLEGTGFNSQEFAESFKLYNKTTVQPIQRDLLNNFKKIIENLEITITPFSLEQNKEEII